jgi:hypothetical protein
VSCTDPVPCEVLFLIRKIFSTHIDDKIWINVDYRNTDVRTDLEEGWVGHKWVKISSKVSLGESLKHINIDACRGVSTNCMGSFKLLKRDARVTVP